MIATKHILRYKQWALVLLGFLLLPLILPAQTKRLDRAEALLRKHSYPYAIELFTNEYKKNPKASTAIRLGDVYYTLQEYESAAQWYKKATAEEGIDIPRETYLQIGKTIISLGNLNHARRMFRVCEKKFGSDETITGYINFCDKLIEEGVESNKYTIQEVGFNSEYAEFGAIPFKAGVLFCSARPYDPYGLKFTDARTQMPLLDLYYVKRQDSINWNTPILLGEVINTTLHEGPICLGQEENEIYFCRSALESKSKSGKAAAIRILSTRQTTAGWETPQKLVFEEKMHTISQPCLSPNGTELYFVSSERSYGGTDIFKATLKNGRWVHIENLGPEINTTGNETFPFITQDGKLYFSSSGHPGFGGQDIFVSKHEKTWSKPKNQGMPLNSIHDDFAFYLIEEDRAGYFSSNRKEGGYGDDIYEFKLKKPEFHHCQPQEELSLCFNFYENNADKALPNELRYVWDFGDGHQKNGISAKHCFEKPGKYQVTLNIIDTLTKEAIFPEASYDIDLKRKEQPYITSLDTAQIGWDMILDAHETFLPQHDIESYVWDFDDGTIAEGANVNHLYTEPGEYTVRLGATGFDMTSGAKAQFCVEKTIQVLGIEQEISLVKPKPSFSAFIKNEDLQTNFSSIPSKKRIFKIQLGTSPEPIPLTYFQSFQLYNVEEWHDQNLYRYFYGNNKSLQSAWEAIQEVRKKGFDNSVLLTFDQDSLLRSKAFSENWLPETARPYIILKGKVDKPISAKIIWWDLLTGKKLRETTLKKDQIEFQENLDKGIYWGYTIQAEGFYPTSKAVDLREYVGDLVIQNEINLHSEEEILSKSQYVQVNNLFFESGKVTFDKISEQELDRLTSYLLQFPTRKVEISGHVSQGVNPAAEMVLSEERAKKVTEYLATAGFPSANLSIRGSGNESPVVSPENAAAEQLNNRIEFRVLK